MSRVTALCLWKKWMKLPADCFETLSFGELAVGQKFIPLPQPGDNHGHGGFKGVHSVFTKTQQRVSEPRFGIPTGGAENSRGVASSFPDSMPVILVE